jgi:hypothetical protein
MVRRVGSLRYAIANREVLPTEDRDFQLISWGKDRTLRIRPIDLETMEVLRFRGDYSFLENS